MARSLHHISRHTGPRSITGTSSLCLLLHKSNKSEQVTLPKANGRDNLSNASQSADVPTLMAISSIILRPNNYSHAPMATHLIPSYPPDHNSMNSLTAILCLAFKAISILSIDLQLMNNRLLSTSTPLLRTLHPSKQQLSPPHSMKKRTHILSKKLYQAISKNYSLRNSQITTPPPILLTYPHPSLTRCSLG